MWQGFAVADYLLDVRLLRDLPSGPLEQTPLISDFFLEPARPFLDSIGPFVYASRLAGMHRGPELPGVPWHQDHTHWDEPCSSDPDPFRVALILYLDDVGLMNGPTEVVPGSHVHEHPIHSHPLEDKPWWYSDTRYHSRTRITGPAGTLFAVDCRVLHRAQVPLRGVRRALLQWCDPLYPFTTAVNRRFPCRDAPS